MLPYYHLVLKVAISINVVVYGTEVDDLEVHDVCINAKDSINVVGLGKCSLSLCI